MALGWIKRKRQGIILSLVLLFPAFLFILFSLGDHYAKPLPIFGPKEAIVKTDSLGRYWDTLYHELPAFSLIDQNGKTFDRKDLEGKVVIANFFFTSCPTICPDMTYHLRELQKRLEGYSDFRIVSHTVDPNNDTPEVLNRYAQKNGSLPDTWVYLTGEKESIYDLAKNGYLVTANAGDGSQNGFVHSEKFVLLDRKGQIRGFYDGTAWAEAKELVEDVKYLLREDLIPFKEKKRHAAD